MGGGPFVTAISGGRVVSSGARGLAHSQVGGGLHAGPLWSLGWGSGRSFDHDYPLGRVEDEAAVREVGDGHIQ